MYSRHSKLNPLTPPPYPLQPTVGLGQTCGPPAYVLTAIGARLAVMHANTQLQWQLPNPVPQLRPLTTITRTLCTAAAQGCDNKFASHCRQSSSCTDRQAYGPLTPTQPLHGPLHHTVVSRARTANTKGCAARDALGCNNELVAMAACRRPQHTHPLWSKQAWLPLPACQQRPGGKCTKVPREWPEL